LLEEKGNFIFHLVWVLQQIRQSFCDWTRFLACEIWGSGGNKYDDLHLLGCDTMFLGRWA